MEEFTAAPEVDDGERCFEIRELSCAYRRDPDARDGAVRNEVGAWGALAFHTNDGEVKICHGAADTVEALATAHVDDLLALCRPV